MEAALYHQAITAGGGRHTSVAASAVTATLATLDRFAAAHIDAWVDCVAQAAEPNPFAEPWFVMASAPALADPADIHVVAAFQGGRLIGMMLLVVEPRYYRLPIAALSNWVHANAFLGMPLLSAGTEAAAMRAMLDALDHASGLPRLLHFTGIVDGGAAHRALLDTADRPVATVLRHERALLRSTLAPADYYEATVRKKKRKELKRLANRLAEIGPVVTRRLSPADDLDEWTAAFLALEASGWKGREGSALDNEAAKRAFFTQALVGARAAGRLEILRMSVGDRTIAMLVNFLCPPGSASFKIAYDEAFARFSPGVLIQIENYDILARTDIDWMDSCAAANHPMIDSLWGERRGIVRLTLPLAGPRGRIAYAASRAVERIWAAIKSRRHPTIQPRNDDDD